MTENKTPLSRLIVSEAIETYGPINRASMAKEIGVTPSGLYYNFTGKRRWFVDTWLKTMSCLGKVQIEGEKIVIETPLAYLLKDEATQFSRTSFRSDILEK